MANPGDPKPDQDDLEAVKSVALDIIARVENSGSHLLANGINNINIRVNYRGATLEVDLSAAKKKHKTNDVADSSHWPAR